MLEKGRIINNRFELREQIGSGLTGVVVRAIDKETEASVALKFIYKNFCETKEELKELTQSLLKSRFYEHPNLVRIYEVGQFENTLFISMEDLGDLDLQTLFNYRLSENKNFTDDEILYIFDKITSVIQYIHLSTHFKNLKPRNIFFRGDIVKITGFAESSLIDWNTYPFIYSELKKSQYVAPELLSFNTDVGKEVDIYSLGAIFYELFNMVPLKSDTNLFNRTNVAKEIENFVDNAAAQRPENRIASASAFFTMLKVLKPFKNISIPNSISFYTNSQSITKTEKKEVSNLIRDFDNTVHNLNILRKYFLTLTRKTVEPFTNTDDSEKSLIFDDEATILTPEEELQQKLKIIKESQKSTKVFKYGYPIILLLIFLLFAGVIYGYNHLKKRRELSQERINLMLLNQISEQNRIENEMRLKAIADYQRKMKDREREEKEQKLIVSVEEKRCPPGMIFTARDRNQAFCIDLYEYPNTRDEMPISSVSYDEASFFCKVKEKRLCQVEELQTACGKENRYPYGEVWQRKACNDDGSNPVPSGSFPQCTTKNGIFDLSGNLAEWTFSENVEATIFGGSFLDNKEMARCKAYKPHPKNTKEEFIGFRCCKEANINEQPKGH